MDKLIKLPVCSGDKASQLSLICDQISFKIRGLESLGTKAEQYGSFLFPLIISKFQLDFFLQIDRVTTGDVWELEELLK